ncbi:MAG: chorismate lyase [Acidobacteria bacterium]|nr:chorismate lyase [Acidobacteriota bacterium]
MDVQFVPTEFLLSTDHWISAEELTGQQVSPVVKTALQYEQLLTLALQEAYGLPSSVELRGNTDWVDKDGNSGLRRDVLIKAGDTVRLVAATLMPHAVLARYPWLATMGNNPLGEMLEKHDAHQRGEFEYRQLRAELIFPSPAETTPLLWARRYRFFLADSHLLVTEIFFPGVLERLGATM